VIGGTLAQTVGIPRTFFVSAGVYLLAFLFVMVGYREVRATRAAPHETEAARLSFRTLATMPHFVLLTGTVFGLQMVDRSLGPILPLYLRELGFASDRVPLMAGILFTTTAGAAAVGNQTSAWLLRNWQASLIVPAMAALAAAAALVFGAAAPWLVLVTTAVVFGYALGAATTCTYTAATHALPASCGAWRSAI